MKILKYNLCTKVTRGTKENPQTEEILSPVVMGWSEANEEIARREAFDGYTIEDDGTEETSQPSQEDRLEALEKAVADIPALIQNAIRESLKI